MLFTFAVFSSLCFSPGPNRLGLVPCSYLVQFLQNPMVPPIKPATLFGNILPQLYVKSKTGRQNKGDIVDALRLKVKASPVNTMQKLLCAHIKHKRIGQYEIVLT